MISAALEVVAQAVGHHLEPSTPPDPSDATSTPTLGPAASTGPSGGMQLLLPAVPWTWPTDANGTSSAALYEFCSWMPASSSPDEPFTFSGIRFSDGYRGFLQSLVPDSGTAAAQQALTNSRFSTTVLYAQSPQVGLPAWEVSQFPQQWVASLGALAATRTTVRVALPSTGEEATATPGTTLLGTVAPGGENVDHPLETEAGQYLEITADAWGLVTIHPSGWYDSALVSLRRRGPYTVGGPRVFFGPAGTLRNLLTGISVALNPTISACVGAGTADAVHAGLAGGSALRVAGLRFSPGSVDIAASDGGTLTCLSTTAPATAPTPTTPMIMGVTVAPLGGGP